MNDNKKQKFIGILFVFTLIVCAIEACTKGWISFALVPWSFIILPVYILMSALTLRQKDGRHIKGVRRSFYALTFWLLAMYVFTVGIIDEPDSILFGFYYTTNNDLIFLSTLLSLLAYKIFVPISFVVLIGFLIANRHKKQNMPAQPHL